MKFMKLGSKPDQFQTDGDNIRYVATELPTDMVINVGDVKFYLHKFPLLSKSSHLQKLVATSIDENDDEYHVDDIPGGPAAFEVCAKFCYGMVVTLNAYNVVAARCAAEYLEMYETIEKGNLVYKIDVFLTSSIFRSWKDSIIVLQTTKSLLTWSEELNIVSHCLDSIATKACVDPLKVDWSYTYNRRKLTSENGKDPLWNGVKKQQNVPKDWWVEDICELQIDLYKRVITAIRPKGRVSADVIGESLKAYSLRRIPSLSKGTLRADDITKYRYLVDTITWLLPTEKNSVPCGFLLKLLQASISLECGETVRRGLIQRIGQQLEEASVSDLLMRFPSGEMNLCSIDIVHDLVEQFVMQEHSDLYTGFTSDASKIKVASLVDGYLAESAKDSSFPLSKFIDLADMVSSFPRLTHDGIYRAIDMYLKEHPEMSKSEKKRICRLMDCKKLSTEACSHAVQNERLPLRVVVQILFFENARASGGSCGSSRTTTTNTDEEDCYQKLNAENVSANKVKKMFSRLWSNKDEIGSDTSESAEETRSTPSRSR